MFTLDKKKFGAFLSQLRKEKGYTQKELARQLFVSDKAVSKWETGASIPDTALLLPLAELLGVSVSELLLCERMARETSMAVPEVEELVKTAIAYPEGNAVRAYHKKSGWMVWYVFALLLGGAGLLWAQSQGRLTEPMWVAGLLGAVFGAYFVFFVPTKLPRCYDENHISAYSDGPLRINLPMVNFSNANWPRIVLVGRVWSCASMALYPLFSLLLAARFPLGWARWERMAFLILLLGGLFLPMYAAGKEK